MGTFVANNWGSLASVLGLCATVLAVWQASRAARSATDAAQQAGMVRDELRKKTLADDLGNLRHLLEPVIVLINARSSESAVALMRPAQHAVSLAISRWGREMDDGRTDMLVRSGVLLRSASRALAGGNLDADRYLHCATTAEKALDLIIKAHGLSLAAIDHLTEEA